MIRRDNKDPNAIIPFISELDRSLRTVHENLRQLQDDTRELHQKVCDRVPLN